MKRLVILFILVAACSSDEQAPPAQEPALDAGNDVFAPVCTGLFGTPNENTGLGSDECSPTCDCIDFTFESFDDATLSAWENATHLNPPEEIEVDPYAEAAPEIRDEVCGVVFEEGGYRTQTYGSVGLAERARAIITHFGPCGACSSLSNLAVYARNPDLTQPVRQCGVEGISGGKDANIECLMDIGFDLPCAQIWFYNTRHTREECLDVCFALLDEPYHEPDGSLNECLLCDERESGPVFKAIAGRTRRNTGLASALCRPCAEVRPLSHDYPVHQ